jgi:hypothetical protein
VRTEDLYNILIEFGVPMKLVRLIKMCLNETYSKVLVGKHLSDRFPIQDGLKREDALSPLIFNFALEYTDRLCGLVVRALGYRSGGPGSIPGTTRKKIVGLEQGALSLMSTTEELLDRKVAAPV